MRKQLTAVAFAMACAASTLAHASRLEQVDMTFQSGATFAGIVTFADDLSVATAVDGVLAGDAYGSQEVSWVWDDGLGNLSTGDANYSTFLMTGSFETGGSDDFIQLGVNYSNPAQLTFTAGQSLFGADNYIDFYDAMVSGTIREIPQPTSVVPELSTARMLASGALVLLAVALRKRRR